MASEHIDRFNIVSTNILKALHGKFPAPFHPTPNTIGLTEEEPVMANGRRQVSEEYEALSTEIRQTLNFLIREGLVYDGQYQIGPSYLITASGLRTLGRLDPNFPTPIIAGA